MKKTTYHLRKMDCSSEEAMVRMKLEPFTFIKKLEFDLGKRELTVYHKDHEEEIRKNLDALSFGLETLSSENISDQQALHDERKNQRKLLWIVLIINLSFFVIEMVTGWLAKSMGLVADSLDMLADSFVYILSLMVVGSTLGRKKLVARVSGYSQLLLATLGFIEVFRRFSGADVQPDFRIMVIVASLALIANTTSLWLFSRSESKHEAHLKASQICTSNDVVINAGVILAGILVYFTGSGIPDLIIGAIVFVLVIKGAVRILKLG